MYPNHQAHGRASIARELSRHYSELSKQHEGPTFSVAEVFRQLGSGELGLSSGYEREVCGSQAKLVGEAFDPHRVRIPLGAFRRDLTAGVAASGGFLVGTAIPGFIADVLRPYSVTAEAGAMMLEEQTASITIPRLVTKPVGQWLTGEATQAPETQPVFGQAALTPKNVSIYMELSRAIKLQSSALTEELLRVQLMGVVGDMLDQAAIAGTGAAGQPLGIVNTPGISSSSGTSLAWSGIRAMRRSVLAAGGRENRLAWIGAPDAQETLSGRERFAGGGLTLWGDTGVAGRPAYASSNVPAGTLLCGDFGALAVAIWGGLGVEVNPYQVFQSGIWSARVILSVDVAVLQPGAFTYAVSIT